MAVTHMNEIIFIQVGQCGNRIGEKFWEKIVSEHGIDSTGVYKGNSAAQTKCVESLFRESDGKFVPRCVLVATEPGTLDSIKSGSMGKLFAEDNYVYGQNGSGNNWAKGHYTEGAELLDKVMERISKEVERCESLDGFIISQSLGGGDGAGLGTLILQQLKKEYPDKTTATFSVFPYQQISETVIEPYNAILSINELIKYADLVFCLDNEALYRICYRELNIATPNYGDINHLVSLAMSGVTAPLRLPKPDGSCETLSGMAKRLAPNPSLKFLSIGMQPLTKGDSGLSRKVTAQELVYNILEERSNLSVGNPYNSKIPAFQAVFLGSARSADVDEAMTSLKKENSDMNVCGSDNSMVNVYEIAPSGSDNVLTLIMNSTSIQETLKSISSRFTVMFTRKAFLHWYIGEGMDEMEFVEAESDLSDLMTEYTRAADEGMNDVEYLVD